MVFKLVFLYLVHGVLQLRCQLIKFVTLISNLDSTIFGLVEGVQFLGRHLTSFEGGEIEIDLA